MSSDSCSKDYGSLMNDQNLYEKAFNSNPDLAKKSIDPGSCKKSNTTASTTTNTKSSTTVVVVTDFGGGGGKGKSSTNSTSQYNATSSQGCAAVAAQYCVNAAVNNGLHCAVSKTKSKAKTEGKQVQTMTITINGANIGGNLSITGGQSSSMTGQIIDFSDQTLQDSMASKVQTQLNNLQSSSQKTQAKNLNFAPTGSQKLFSDAISGAVTSSSSTTTADVIKNTLTNLFQSQGDKIVLTGITVKGNATINEMQTEAEAFVIKQLTDNIVGSMMTVKTVNTSTNTQKSTQSTKVSGRKELKASPVGGDSKGSSHFVFLLLMLICLVGFSMIEAPAKVRAGCFYLACVLFLVLLLLDHSKHKLVLWLSIIFFVIGCIVNTKEWNLDNDEFKIGGGFSDGILPFPKSGTTIIKKQKIQTQQGPQVSHNDIYGQASSSVQGKNAMRKQQGPKQKIQTQKGPQISYNDIYRKSGSSVQGNNAMRKRQGVAASTFNIRHRINRGNSGQAMI